MKSKSMKTVKKLSRPSKQPKVVEGELLPPLVIAQKWNPHAYMKKAVKFLLEHACAALFLDPGLGKTSITLAALLMLFKRKLISKVLIVAPLRVAGSTWPREMQKWTDFRGLRYVVLHGPKKDQLLREDADIYIINFEGLEWLLDVTKTKNAKGKTQVHVDVKRFKKFGFDVLVVDELSKLKNTQTVRFKALKLVLNTFGRRWGLTGSPAANGLLDLFGQTYVLDMGNALGQYITHYRMEYFVPSRDGYNWDLAEGSEERIYKALSPLVLRMAAKDYLDLPQEIPNNIFVDLPPEARKVYDELEDELIAALEQGEVVAANSAVASGKCRQVASGGVYLTPDVTELIKKKTNREYAHLHHEKTDALVDLIEELQGSPILVAYDFAHDLERIREKLDADIPYIGGGVSLKRSKELEHQWNAGKLPYLFAHPASIAHGLNLQEAGHHVGWYTLTWNYEEYDQFIKRVLRQGNKSKRVFVHHFLARDTIDEYAVLPALQRKRRGQNALFDGLKELQRRRRSRR